MEELEGQLTPAQEEELKSKYGNIVMAKADGHVAYFKKPTRQTVSYAITLQQQNKTVEMLEHVLKNCHVAGSVVFVKETDYMLGAAGIVEKLIVVKQAEIKNL